MKDPRVAELQYSRDYKTVEVVVPHGTKMTDLGKVIDFIARDVIGKLPRGCTPCTSGDHLVIRERLEHVIRVDLDRNTILTP